MAPFRELHSGRQNAWLPLGCEISRLINRPGRRPLASFELPKRLERSGFQRRPQDFFVHFKTIKTAGEAANLGAVDKLDRRQLLSSGPLAAAGPKVA